MKETFTGVLAGALAVACGAAETAESRAFRDQAAVPDTAMSAAVVRQWGPPEALQVESVPRPAAGAGELVVRVHAAAVNPIDAQVRAGPGAGFVGATLPYVPGFDVSGVVAEAGADAGGFAVGDEVYAMLDLRRGGGYAEYARVMASEAARKPTSATHAEAAALPLVALTAWQALFETADLRPGQTVLVHAGAGGVGSVAVQLAKWRGATVIATASEPNHAFLLELGVDRAIDYRTDRFEGAGPVDVVIDPIGGDTQRRSLGVIREGGILVSLVGLTAEAQRPPANVRATSILVRPDSAQLARIAGLVDEGVLRPVVSHLFTLNRAPEAHLQIETGRTRGKIVLEVRR